MPFLCSLGFSFFSWLLPSFNSLPVSLRGFSLHMAKLSLEPAHVSLTVISCQAFKSNYLNHTTKLWKFPGFSHVQTLWHFCNKDIVFPKGWVCCFLLSLLIHTIHRSCADESCCLCQRDDLFFPVSGINGDVGCCLRAECQAVAFIKCQLCAQYCNWQLWASWKERSNSVFALKEPAL